jgi:hypothetical protein
VIKNFILADNQLIDWVLMHLTFSEIRCTKERFVSFLQIGYPSCPEGVHDNIFLFKGKMIHPSSELLLAVNFPCVADFCQVFRMIATHGNLCQKMLMAGSQAPSDSISSLAN